MLSRLDDVHGGGASEPVSTQTTRALRAVPNPITIAVAEDSYIIRESFARMLCGHDGVEVAAVCPDLWALEQAIDRFHPDVVITEITIRPSTGHEGIVLAAQLRRTHPGIGVLVLSRDLDVEAAEQLFHPNASGRGYLLKQRIRHSGELITAIEAVHRGESAVDPEIVTAMMRTSSRAERSQLSTLTPRERQLLALVAEGRSNAAIAESLVLTKRAVEKHVNSIFRKLGLQTSGSEQFSRRVKAALIFVAQQGR
jgi:DNA-binding NarL/FixJ family response regulator